MAYYYSILDNNGKYLYDLIFDGINKLVKKIVLPSVSRNDAFLAFNSVLYDNPFLFYTRAFRFSANLLGINPVLMPVYKYNADFINQSADVISDYFKLFDSVINESDLEKELFVHDYCLDHFTYDYDFNEHAFSILGPVIFNTGVCEGISKFVKVALNYLGVKCIVATGEALNPSGRTRGSEKHMWNIVYINGTAYNLDVTFNLSQKGSVNRYDFFNLSDGELKKSHKITKGTPTCNTAGHDYYTLSNQVVSGLSGAEAYIRNELLSGKSNIVFKLTENDDDLGITDKIMRIASASHQNIINRSGAVNVKPNLKQGVFEIEFIT